MKKQKKIHNSNLTIDELKMISNTDLYNCVNFLNEMRNNAIINKDSQAIDEIDLTLNPFVNELGKRLEAHKLENRS